MITSLLPGPKNVDNRPVPIRPGTSGPIYRGLAFFYNRKISGFFQAAEFMPGLSRICFGKWECPAVDNSGSIWL
ncbi:MAG: hypothetical protein B5M56_01125 [Desulfococcus sp. 4484_241]|nr:MAG: hypothetical protein B5M56_01125 [Desulfococcus sp. 4484_241]